MAKTLPQLYQKPNGRWYIRWTGDHGSKDEKSLKVTDQDEANKLYAEWLPTFLKMKVAAEEINGAIPRTVHWCLDYYETHQVPKVTNPKSARKQIAMWRNFFPENYMMHELNNAKLEEWQTLRRHDRKFKGGTALKTDGTPKINNPIVDGTIRNELILLRSARNYCFNEGRLSGAMIKIRLPEKPDSRTEWITEDQFVDQLMPVLFTANVPCVPGRKGRWLCGLAILGLIMFGTGRRIEAVASLKWDKVDFDRRVINFEIKGRRKTKKIRGTAKITEWMLPWLRRAHEERCSDWVCIEKIGFSNQFSKYARRAGFVTSEGESMRVTAHTMRHSYVTNAWNNGSSLDQIADNVGCSVETMAKTYAHLSEARRGEVAEKALDGKIMRRLAFKVVKK